MSNESENNSDILDDSRMSDDDIDSQENRLDFTEISREKLNEVVSILKQGVEDGKLRESTYTAVLHEIWLQTGIAYDGVSV